MRHRVPLGVKKGDCTGLSGSWLLAFHEIFPGGNFVSLLKRNVAAPSAAQKILGRDPAIVDGRVVMPALRCADSLTSTARRCREASAPGDEGLTWSA